MDLLGLNQAAQYPDTPYGMMNKEAGPLPVRVQIEREMKMHEQEVKRLNAMLQLITDHPAIEQFINLQRGYTG